MIDFPIMPEDATKGSWLICASLYFSVLLIYNRDALCPGCYKSNTFKFKGLFVFLTFTLIVCSFYNGDWAHYQSLVLEYRGQKLFHLEDIYRPLILFIHNNYLLFRIIVWGIGYVAMFYTFKLCGLNPYTALYYLFCIYVSTYSYARAGVAMAVYFLGLVLLFCRTSNKFNKFVIGVGLIVLSYFFHKSMIVPILLTPLTLVPINKKTIFFILIGIAVIAFAFSAIMESATGYLASSKDLSYSADLYIGKSGSITANRNLSGTIVILWSKMIIHLPFLICIYYFFRDGAFAINSNIKAIFRIAFGIEIFAILMLISYGSAAAIYYRYEGMLYIPITILVCYLHQRGVLSAKTFKYLFWFCAGYQIEMFLYMIFLG